jgi:D-glycero-D-manno-heptose 1,7-bisphosphate phosphatase
MKPMPNLKSTAKNKAELEEVAKPHPLDPNRPRPCVFVDRDGVITKDVGYCNHPDRLELLAGSAAALRRLNRYGILAIGVSNQSGVARKIFSEEVLELIHERMRELLALRNARLDALYYAPQHPRAKDPRYRDDPDQMRKPGIGMIRRACAEWPIDMERSYMVGDKPTDIEFGHNAGLTTIMVKTGYGLGEIQFNRHQWIKEPHMILDNLQDAVAWAIKDLRRRGWRPQR